MNRLAVRDVFAPGSPVEIGPEISHIPATVVSSTIHATGIVYCVSWWDGRGRQQQNLDEFEVRAAGGSRREAVGFRGNGSDR